MSTSSDGKTWSAVTRIPIDATTSTVDHFIPGIGIDPTHLRQQRAPHDRLLLLSTAQLHHQHVPAGCRLRNLDGRRRDLDRGAQIAGRR